MPAAYLYIPERHKKFKKILTSFDTNANLNRVKFAAITTVFLVFTETWDLLYLKLTILKDDTTMRTICTFKRCEHNISVVDPDPDTDPDPELFAGSGSGLGSGINPDPANPDPE
jgi:hypothetical protein